MEEGLDIPLEDDPRVPALDAWDEDRFTFEDSDRFEEDSLCSWSTEPESLCNNWRGWKRPAIQSFVYRPISKRLTEDGEVKIPTLTELSAKVVASHIPFELVEHVFPPVPEQLQLRIAFWSFPDNEEDIRLYSCLANGSSDEFQRGDHLFRSKAVRDTLQIGFHLSAAVVPPPNFVNSSREQHNVAVTFDRRRITSCNCTCNSSAYWCSHVVAVCLHRINNPDSVCLRAPVSESLSRLKREQLQKFAQYLISELPQQILPTAQRLLDELLSGQPSAINSVCGAPDPTAGASISDQTSWYLDQKTLHVNIKKILIKFCIPAPMVFSDVNCLSTTAPPAAAEWSSLLRPLRGREPEGMWNLLSIVMEMFKRNDRNAVPLLEIITEECMACEQIVVWWYMTCAALHSGVGSGKHPGANSNAHASQHACSSLCDEIVVLWRLAALNPGISPEERLLFEKKFKSWHSKILDKVAHSRTNLMNTSATAFPGFKPAIQACHLDWEDYPIPGVTYTVGSNQLYHSPFTCFKQNEGNVNQVNSSHAVLNCQPHSQYHSHPFAKHKKTLDYYTRRRDQSGSLENGYRSSVSSEGFCENEADGDLPSHSRDMSNERDDVDSQEGGGSDSASSSEMGAVCQRGRAGGNERSLSSERDKKMRGMKEPSQSSEDSDMGVFISGDSNPYAERSEMGAGASGVYQPGRGSQEKRCTGMSGMSLEDVHHDLRSEHVLHKQRDCDSEIDSPRRASNDSNTSNSDSPNSGDEYSLYYFKQIVDKSENVLASTVSILEKKFEKEKGLEDPWDILFARSEGLHAHGHNLEACTLAVRLAEELLENPPDLSLDLSLLQGRGKRRKIHPATHQLSCLASATLAKCAFLCSVLAEVPDHNHLAFRVGMFGLEMTRPPASTKPLEVKLANQESELVNLMKRIPLGPQELRILRQKAEQLRDGTLRSRGEALLPIMLASFIFDALVGSPAVRETKSDSRFPEDEPLAFEAAVAVLGLKANVSEADHPLLCEGTRRQRGDLALTLLMHYKDEESKVTIIMEKLLDREVHNLIKSPLSGWYYSTTSNPRSHSKRFSTPSGIGSAEDDLDNLASGYSNSYDPATLQDLPSSLGSRPHSSTSSEIEQGFGSMSLGGTPGSSHSRHKDSLPRFKNKRLYPSIPNQPSEAGAHFMFELAKIVLNKAGGNSSTSLFTQPSTSQHHHGPHRTLHFCAFQIGLYALGLHNCVSPNWLSRTYSSHVSWITGQAMEIGVLAISFLINSWEGHLTPPEAASIADRASRAGDPNMVRAAAQLALSCLPHAHALNPNEIQRAIVQCKEQSESMLEQSCITVENAAKGGGVYPEVLFQVAKYWYDLYVRNSSGGQEQGETESPPDPMPLHFSVESSPSVLSLADSQDMPIHQPHQQHQQHQTHQPHHQHHQHQHHQHQHQHQHQPHQHQPHQHQPHPQHHPHQHQSHQSHQSHQPHQPHQAHQPHQPHQQHQHQQLQQIPQIPQIPQHAVPMPPPPHPPPTVASTLPMMTQPPQSGVVMTTSPPTLVPVQYAVPPPYSFVQPIHSLPPPPPPPSRLSVYLPPPPPPPQYQYPNTPPAPIPPQQYFVQGNSQPPLRPVPYPITTMQQQVVSTPNQMAVVQPQSVPVTSTVNVHIQQPGPGPVPVNVNVNVTQPSLPPPPPPVGSGRSVPQQQHQQQHQQSQTHRQGQNAYSPAQFRCLISAFRVGLLALETLARRVHDDRPQAKYARNPPYGDDIKWLLQVSKKLGTHHLQQFCMYVVNSIVSPFILHEVAIEAAHFMARNNPSLVLQHLRSSLTPLVQKCQQMYIQCMHQKLYHLTSSDYEEFVNVVCAAKAAFLITPEGTQQFKEWLQSIKRSKSCKKELWTQINNALAANSK